MTLNYGNYGIFLILDNAGFISSTVFCGVPIRVHHSHTKETKEDPKFGQALVWV